MMMPISRQILSIVTGFCLTTLALGSAWNDWQDVQEAGVYRIVQYLDVAANNSMVIIDVGTNASLLKGAQLKVYRHSPAVHADKLNRLKNPQGNDGKIWVETGSLKVVDVQDRYTVAEVTQQGSILSKALFPKFPGVMAGDLAVEQRLNIVANQAIIPTITLSYKKLFIDPKAAPSTFEMSTTGLEALREAAKTFADAKLSLLMVEGYTDSSGSADANQLESYQRALTVRQYLIEELGFDDERVVAMGFGEGEPVDMSNAPGYVEANRRVVLKAVTLMK